MERGIHLEVFNTNYFYFFVVHFSIYIFLYSCQLVVLFEILEFLSLLSYCSCLVMNVLYLIQKHGIAIKSFLEKLQVYA